MKEIARAAGVSQPTVSLVLGNRRGGTARISEATRERVLATARQLKYRPNQIARSMVLGRSNVIGFFAAGFEWEYVARSMTGALAAAESAGYLLKLFECSDPDRARNAVDRALSQQVAAVIARKMVGCSPDDMQTTLAAQGVPFALIDSEYRLSAGIRVTGDDRGGALAAIRHLLELGHRRVLCVSLEAKRWSLTSRTDGFRQAVSDAGLSSADMRVFEDVDPDRLEARVLTCLSERPERRPTAIFCTTDHLALHTMRAARKAGLRIPEDVSVVGFAGLEMTELCDPPLTTVAQPFREIGETAVACLLEELALPAEQRGLRRIEKIIPTRLVIRASTASRDAGSKIQDT